MEKKSGIYRIRCTVTGEFYIGSSVNLLDRISEHKYDLRHARHDNYKLLAEWERHGEGNFEFTIIELCPDVATLYDREQHYFDTLNPQLNIAIDARRPSVGLKRSQASKDKQSRARKKAHDRMTPKQKAAHIERIKAGVKQFWDSLTEEEKAEARQRRSHGQTDEVRRILSEKSKANHARPMLGKHPSPETLEKMRLVTQSRWDVTKAERDTEKARKQAEFDAGRKERELARVEKVRIANTGKKRTLEHKEHLRQVALAQQQDPEYKARHEAGLLAVMQTPEMREKLSKAHKGKKLSAEHRANIGKAGRGKKRSEESKKRLSDARRKWWAERKLKKGK